MHTHQQKTALSESSVKTKQVQKLMNRNLSTDDVSCGKVLRKIATGKLRLKIRKAVENSGFSEESGSGESNTHNIVKAREAGVK